MTALIVDDEQKNRNLLRGMLNMYCPQIQIVGEASDGKDGLMQIRKLNPGVVFLDIKMPVLDGFEMLDVLGDFTGSIVFVTAYNEFAIKAIRYAAFDYLLKPVDPEELVETIKRLEERPKSTALQLRLEQISASFQQAGRQRKISIPSVDGITLVAEPDIVFLEASGAYTLFYLQSGEKLLSSKNLKEYEELLDSQSFYRCHHSFLVNLNHIKKYSKAENYLLMTGNHQIDISKRKKDDFLHFLSRWKGG